MASNLVQLLDEKIKIENWLSSVWYGSIETRVRTSKKYIYVHYRNKDKLITKYAGEYSARLVNIIYENTMLAKELKKRLKVVNKQLKTLNYVEKDLKPTAKNSMNFIKSNLTNLIFNQVLFDDIDISYSSVDSLVQNDSIIDLSIYDANKVANLKNAWNFILNKDVINTKLSYALLSQINSLIDTGFSYNAGKLRRIPLQIENSSYIPTIPFESSVNENLDLILNTKDKPMDKALNILVYLLRSFVFTNSNINTALIFVNCYLIKNGLGMLSIPYLLKQDLNKYLLDLYEWNEKDSIKKFILEHCYFEK